VLVEIHSLWAVAQERELVAAGGRGNELVVYDDVPFFWGALCVCLSGISLCVHVCASLTSSVSRCLVVSLMAFTFTLPRLTGHCRRVGCVRLP
jgi:hypothetical protein